MNIIVTHNVQLGLSKTLNASRHQAALCQDDSIHDPEMRQSALQLTPREAAALAERCECPLPCGQLGTPVMLTRRAPKAYLSERTSLFLATKCHDDRVKASHTFHKIVSTLLECHLPTHSGYKRSRPFLDVWHVASNAMHVKKIARNPRTSKSTESRVCTLWRRDSARHTLLPQLP